MSAAPSEDVTAERATGRAGPAPRRIGSDHAAVSAASRFGRSGLGRGRELAEPELRLELLQRPEALDARRLLARAKKAIVGMLMMLKARWSAGFASMSTFTTSTAPSYFSASRSISGATILHGPHQVRPEVDHDGPLALEHDLLERRVGHVLDLHHGNRLPFSRFEARCQPPSRARLWMSR